MYVGEARFALARPPGSIDLASFVTLPFIERIDPAIKHRLITPDEAVSAKDPRAAHNQHPLRRWCDARPVTICIRSRYQFEGKLPVGIQIANKPQGGVEENRGLPRVRERAHAAPAGGGHRDGPCDLDRPRHAAGRRARAEHLLRQPGDAVRQAARRLSAASDRRQPDHRHRVHCVGGRDAAFWPRRRSSPRCRCCAIWCPPKCSPARARSTAATRSARDCRSMRAIRSRPSPRFWSASKVLSDALVCA